MAVAQIPIEDSWLNLEALFGFEVHGGLAVLAAFMGRTKNVILGNFC